MNFKYIPLTALFCGVLSLTALPAHAVGLKENSIVTDNTIKLGDVFYDLPRDADRVLGSAPRPGQEMVLNAKTLLRIALALDLPWRPVTTADHVVLRREATVIDETQIKENLRAAFIDDGVYGDYEIVVPTQYREIILPHDQPAEFDVTRLNIDTARKTFEATISAPSRDNPIQQFHMTGRLFPVIQVPILKTNIQNGRSITANDIDYIKVRERDFSQGTVADAQSLIGMTARRMLIAGRPLKENELTPPQAVERGEMVMLSLRAGTMNITTQVKALQNGAKGDIIRVVNMSSNQTLQAIITDDNAVTVVQN